MKLDTDDYYLPAFFFLSLAFLSAIFTVCSVRTNVLFVAALTLLVLSLTFGAGAFFNLALGNETYGAKLAQVSLPWPFPTPCFTFL